MADRVRKPEWLKINIGANDRYTETKRIVDSHCLHTICSSGRCPNMGECWGKGTATFMINIIIHAAVPSIYMMRCPHHKKRRR